MNGKKAKAQRKSNGDRGQGYLRRLRKQDKTARQTQDSTPTTPAVPVAGQNSKAVGPKQHNQPDYGPVIDTHPVYNAKAATRMALATTAEPPLHWFEKAQKLLRLQGLAQRIGKPRLMELLGQLRLN